MKRLYQMEQDCEVWQLLAQASHMLAERAMSVGDHVVAAYWQEQGRGETALAIATLDACMVHPERMGQ